MKPSSSPRRSLLRTRALAGAARVGSALALAALAAFAACTTAPAGGRAAAGDDRPGAIAGDASADETFERLVHDYVAERARLDPEWGTGAGLHDGDGLLTHYDDASWNRRRQLNTDTLGKLAALDAAALSREVAVDHALLTSQLQSADYEYRRQDARTVAPGIPLGAMGSINNLLIRDFAPREVRVENAMARLRQVPVVCAELRAALAHPPALWTRLAIDDTGGALSFLDGVPDLSGPADGLPEAVAEARAALEDYRRFLQNDLLPRSDGSFALGREAFEFHLHTDYQLAMGADQLLALGQQQWDRTIALLESTAKEIEAAQPPRDASQAPARAATTEPPRDWRALLAGMMEQHPTAGDLMQTYRDEVAHARQFLIDRHVVGIPDEKLQVLETPAFMRSTTPFAAYDAPAALDQSRLGTFFVTPEPEAHILSDIPGTVWHEAYPGHHLQFVYAKDNPSLVRRLNGSPMLSEGWGFYCEELASETGYYDDPHERLMQLDWRLQRCARVILDVSVHVLGMGYEDAVAFLMDNVGLKRAQAEASVNAYTQQPTYFSSYMLGMLEIVRIREEFRARLGSRFSLHEFHERLLRCGNIPPALIEQELLATWR